MSRLLRIAHVVAVYSDDGAYGGPTRVALAQAKQLSLNGHEVTIFAGWLGDGEPPRQVSGVTAVLFPLHQLFPIPGFAGVTAPGLWRELRRRLDTFDLIHVHLARDLITLPIANAVIRRGARVVAQPHGMISKSSNPLAKPLDAIMTRGVLRGASRVFALSTLEASELNEVAAIGLPVELLANGIEVEEPIPREKKPTREVLFLARLHARKRPLAFVHAAIALTAHWPEVRFTLVGPDGGEAAAVNELIASSGLGGQISWEGPIEPDSVTRRIGMAEIYVLPAIAEPFGLTLLEAMSVGVPVVLGEDSTLASQVSKAGAGLTFGSEVDSLQCAIDEYLRDPELGIRAGTNGRALVVSEWSIANVVGQLERAYMRVAAN